MMSEIFPTTYFFLKISGFWRPYSLKLPLYLCYQIYTAFSFATVLSLIILLVLYCAFAHDKFLELLLENMYLVISFSNCISKTSNIILRKKNVEKLLQWIREKRWLAERDLEESCIVAHSKLMEKAIPQFCTLLVCANGIGNLMNPIIRANPDKKLVIEAYPICDRSRPVCFWLTYLHQCFGFVIVNVIHVACDCLIYNFIDRTCAHLKILGHRLQKLPVLVKGIRHQGIDTVEFEKSYVIDCIKNHQGIFIFIRELNDTFCETVFFQFLSSILVLCTNIFLLSKQELFSPEFIAVFSYFCCVLAQNFFYCWYGYKLSVNSLAFVDAIAKINWVELDMKTKKMLVYMMLITSNKVELFNNAVVNLSPASFINIVKISYSAFTVLQRTSHKEMKI
ncbi:odorant receptor 113 [Nasonia vitripennis]|uniref:Odorant receptor n=1 Tax=Nasonia vitripennis TaxID=7425 RepID=A0A7M6UW75_NASVI|nr:odorant receptor 113 [Nasonia vitripennis]